MRAHLVVARQEHVRQRRAVAGVLQELQHVVPAAEYQLSVGQADWTPCTRPLRVQAQQVQPSKPVMCTSTCCRKCKRGSAPHACNYFTGKRTSAAGRCCTGRCRSAQTRGTGSWSSSCPCRPRSCIRTALSGPYPTFYPALRPSMRSMALCSMCGGLRALCSREQKRRRLLSKQAAGGETNTDARMSQQGERPG